MLSNDHQSRRILKRFQKASNPGQNDENWSILWLFHVVFSSFSHPPLRSGKKTKKRHLAPLGLGQIAHLEVLSCRFFVFLSFFLFSWGGLKLVRWPIWRSSDVVFSSFWLFFFFPGGYKIGQMAYLEVFRCRFFVFLSFCLFSWGV